MPDIDKNNEMQDKRKPQADRQLAALLLQDENLYSDLFFKAVRP